VSLVNRHSFPVCHMQWHYYFIVITEKTFRLCHHRHRYAISKYIIV